MPALPPSTDFTGSSVTEGQFKTALTALRTYLADLFGADGLKTTALATLGAATPAELPVQELRLKSHRFAKIRVCAIIYA